MNAHSIALRPLRAEIDTIDDEILRLIERRAAVADAIGASKRAEQADVIAFRPRRHAQVVARLQGRTGLPAGLVSAIWRELMAHALQVQARTELVLCGGESRELLEARVRARFGEAAPILWAEDAEAALRRASEGEALAVIAGPLPPVRAPLRLCATLCSPDGAPSAWVVGRVSEEESLFEDAVASSSPHRPMGWSPASWRGKPARQLPTYPDPARLADVENRLAKAAPLVPVPEIRLLREALAKVAGGEGFLLQGGDCAESFDQFGAGHVRAGCELLLDMGAELRAAGEPNVVHVARIAGQFAKPRSSDREIVNGVALPSYRGDAVNGAAPDPRSRQPDPRRLLQAHAQARATIDLLGAYADASSAGLARLRRSAALPQPRPIFTSHEALLLPYEQALARYDEETGCWWATSGHMIWIGDRTRDLDGAHVEFARGVANPIGLKCGPTLDPDGLLRLIDRLDPDNRAGRLVLIGRFGAEQIERCLPPLLRACRREGRNAIWSIDPMHGNTRTIGGVKTRRMSDVRAEVRSFFDLCRTEGVHPGGVHLEMTAAAVTECIGMDVAEGDLNAHYLSLCDPRLNGAQARAIAADLAQQLRRASGPERSAA